MSGPTDWTHIVRSRELRKVLPAQFVRRHHVIRKHNRALTSPDNVDGVSALAFWPHFPPQRATAIEIARRLGLRVTRDRRSPGTVRLVWDQRTVVPASIPDRMLRSRPDSPINAGCLDISKRYVGDAYRDAFGVVLNLDPLTHDGPMVQKSDENALHDGRIVTGPVAHADPVFVYQRVVDNEWSPGSVVDLRVPVIKGQLPFVYVKRRPKESRFSNVNTSVDVADPKMEFDVAELEQIAVFSRAIGLQYGELDTLRDRYTGELFIVDANKTPWGLPNALRPRVYDLAVDLLAESFAEQFLG